MKFTILNIQLLLLATFMLISLAKGCHPSCNCKNNTNVCNTCKFPGSIPDIFNVSCPCPEGYFRASLNPFNCSSLHDPLTQEEIFSQCRFEIGTEIGNFLIGVQQSQVFMNKISYLNSTIVFDLRHVSLSDSCLQVLASSFQVYNSKFQRYEPLQPLNNLNFTNNINSKLSQVVLAPISQIEKFSEAPIAYSDGTVSYNVRFAIFLATTSDVLRQFIWNLIISVQQKKTFLFTIKNTIGPGSQLQNIVVADVKTKGLLCADISCQTAISSPSYSLGDTFIAKVNFTDPTYNRYLLFSRTFLKIKSGKILNYTPITTSSWDGSCIIIQFPLLDISDQIIVQINLLISNNQTHLRTLAENDSDSDQSQDSQGTIEMFEISVAPSTKEIQPSLTHGNILQLSMFTTILAFVIFVCV